MVAITNIPRMKIKVNIYSDAVFFFAPRRVTSYNHVERVFDNIFRFLVACDDLSVFVKIKIKKLQKRRGGFLARLSFPNGFKVMDLDGAQVHLQQLWVV